MYILICVNYNIYIYIYRTARCGTLLSFGQGDIYVKNNTFGTKCILHDKDTYFNSKYNYFYTIINIESGALWRATFMFKKTFLAQNVFSTNIYIYISIAKIVYYILF
jgi:hypothetical protein